MKIVRLALAASLALPGIAQAATFSFQTIDNPGDPTFNQLLGINDAGTIAGYYGSGAAGHPNQGYEVMPPYTAFTPVNYPGAAQTQAIGIDNAGDIVGFYANTNLGSGDNNFGFLATPLMGGFSYAGVNDPKAVGVNQVLGINNKGVAVGFYNDANGVSHAFTYTIATGTFTPYMPFEGQSTTAAAINDNGDIAGFYTTAGGRMLGFVQFANGTIKRFGVPNANATQLLGINNSDVAVGLVIDKRGITHGLYYLPKNHVGQGVDVPGATGGTALNGVNNKNQLVGFYTDAAGVTHGLLVTVTN